MKLDNRWVISDGTLNDMPITIHNREDWQAIAGSGRYSICVQIAWYAIERSESNGYPSEQEMQKIEVFHHQIQAQFEQQGHAVIAMVITHDGINQWVIYSDDIESIASDLNLLTVSNSDYPIEIVADEDPDWETFSKVYKAIQ